MARFLNHEPCPRCNSRDNLGRYDDGSAWCFGGCGYYEPPKRRRPTDYRSARPRESYFNDWTTELPEANKQWLRKYGLTDAEISRFRYSSHYDRHVYAVHDSSGSVTFFEARSVTGALPKSLQHGEKPLHIIGPTAQISSPRLDCIVLVEDIVSAIRVGRQAPACPLWGSNLSKEHYPYLKGLTDELIFWLDYDKYPEAIKQAKNAGLYGFKTRVIKTKHDPKELSDDAISAELHGNRENPSPPM